MSPRKRSFPSKFFLAELYRPHANLDVNPGEASSELARCVRVIAVPGDDACFLLYQSASAEDVRLAGEQAGLRFTRVVDAETTELACTHTGGSLSGLSPHQAGLLTVSWDGALSRLRARLRAAVGVLFGGAVPLTAAAWVRTQPAPKWSYAANGPAMRMRIALLAIAAAVALALANAGPSAPPGDQPTYAFHYAGTSLAGEQFTTPTGTVLIIFDYDREGALRGSFAFELSSQWAVLAQVTPKQTLTPVQALPQPGQTAPQPDLTHLQLPNIHSLSNVQQIPFQSQLPDPAIGSTLIFTKESGVSYVISNADDMKTGQTLANSAATENSGLYATLNQVDASATSETTIAKRTQPELTQQLDKAIASLEEAISQEKSVDVYLYDNRLKKASESLLASEAAVALAKRYYADAATGTALAGPGGRAQERRVFGLCRTLRLLSHEILQREEVLDPEGA